MVDVGAPRENEKDDAEESSPRLRLRKSLSRLPGPLVFVLVCAAIYFVVFSAFTMNRHEVYSSARFDLGNMDQAVWNTSEGRILEATSEDGENRSRLANHADFLLLLFAPCIGSTQAPTGF